LLPHRPKSAAVLAPLAGAALLTALALWSLPWRDGLGRPLTPIDRSTARALRPGYLLLTAAAGVIPDKASFVVRTEPPDAEFETWYHRLGVAFLPGRRALPAAYLGGFTASEVWRDADYLVLVGPAPRQPPGELVLATTSGSVWRLGKPR
jgi:hypothetical protein